METVSCLTDTVLAVYPKVLLSEVATVDEAGDGIAKDTNNTNNTNDTNDTNDMNDTNGTSGDTNKIKSKPGESKEDKKNNNPKEDTNNTPRRQILIQIALSVARAMTPVVRRFLALGMQRQLLRNGDPLYDANAPARAMWLVISGRLRTFTKQDGK